MLTEVAQTGRSGTDASAAGAALDCDQDVVLASLPGGDRRDRRAWV